MKEQYLWMLSNQYDDEDRITPAPKKKGEQITEIEPPPFVSEYQQMINLWEELKDSDLENAEKARIIRESFPDSSVNRIATNIEWKALSFWLKSEKTRKTLKENARKYASDKRSVIDKIKLDSGCCVCGYKRCSKALDFHHLDPKTKEDGISRMHNLEKILEEIKKCVIVCRCCHAEIHAGLIEL